MVAGALAGASVLAGWRVGLSMPRECTARDCSAWAMLARPLGGDEAPGVGARWDADDAPEVPMQLALVVEPDGLRRVGDEHAAPEQLPGAGDPDVGQVRVR